MMAHIDYIAKRIIIVGMGGVGTGTYDQVIRAHQGLVTGVDTDPETVARHRESGREVIRILEELSREDKPFFMAVGLSKPHLPFVAPRKYWDLYDHQRIARAAGARQTSRPPGPAPSAPVHRPGRVPGRAPAGLRAAM